MYYLFQTFGYISLGSIEVKEIFIYYVHLALLQRITIKEIKNHPWFLKNLPRELTESSQANYYQRDNLSFSLQSVEEIMKIVGEARIRCPSSRSIGGFGWGAEEGKGGEDDLDVEEEEIEEEDEYDKRVREVHASGEFHVS